LSRGKSGLLVEFLNFGIKLAEDGAERAGEGVGVRQQRGPVGAEDPKIQLGIEKATLSP
jgi:hypothetical protein